jgi:hypothetical protein
VRIPHPRVVRLAGCLLLWHSRRMRCCSTSMLCMRTMLLAASAGVCVALNNSLGTTPQSACTASVHKCVVSGWQWHCQAGQPACLFARGRFSAHSLRLCVPIENLYRSGFQQLESARV